MEISCRGDVRERAGNDKGVLEEKFSELHRLLDSIKTEVLSTNPSISLLEQITEDVRNILIRYQKRQKSPLNNDDSWTSTKNVEEESKESVQTRPDAEASQGVSRSRDREVVGSRVGAAASPGPEDSLHDAEDVAQVKDVLSPDAVLLHWSRSAALAAMLSRCRAQANRSPSFSLREWIALRPGARLLAKLDGAWHRCEVAASRQSLPPVDAANVRKVLVRSEDAGELHWAEFSLSRMLAPCLATPPALCQRHTLAVLPPRGAWAEEEVAAIADVIEGRCFLVQRLPGRGVDLWPLPRRAGLSVRQWIVAAGLGRLEEAPDWRPEPGVAPGPGLLFPDPEGEAAVAAHRSAAIIELPDTAIVRFACLDAPPALWVTPHPLCDSLAFRDGHAAIHDGQGLFCPRAGGLYLARFHDKLWYRCLVESVEDRRATVLSVDFGNYWTVEWETGVRRMRRRWQGLPYLARRVKLADVKFVDNLEVNSLSDALQASSVYLMRYAHAVDNNRPVSDFVYLLHRSACVNLSLVESGLATSTVEQSRVMRNLVARTAAHVRRHFKVDPPSGSLQDAPLPPPPLGFISAGSARAPGFVHCRGNFKVDVAIGDTTPLTGDALRAVDRRLGLLTDGEAGRLSALPRCSVTHVASPEELFVRLETPERQREREHLSAALQTLHTSHQHPTTRLQSAEAAVTGELCAVVRPIHLEWCRGMVVGPGAENGHLRVLFIDTGEQLSVPCSYVVQPLAASFVSSFPLSSIRCRVLGVVPACSDDGKWSVTARSDIVELLRPRGAPCRLSRVAVSSAGVSVDLLIPDADLGLRQGVEEEEEEEAAMRSLSEKLCDIGVALRGPEPEIDATELPTVPVCPMTLRQQLGIRIQGRRNPRAIGLGRGRAIGLGRGRVELPRQKTELTCPNEK